MSGTKKVIDTQAGAQTLAAETRAELVVYTGGAGTGKSFLCAYEAMKHFQVPNYGALIVRRTYPQLTGPNSIWEEVKKLAPMLGATLNRSQLYAYWPRYNSQVICMHLQHDSSVKNHMSKRYDYIGLDEGTDLSAKQTWMIWSRLGSISGVRKKMVIPTNPDPDWHGLPLVEPYIDDQGDPLFDSSGIVRWFARVGEEIETWPSEQDIPEDIRPIASSYTVIHGKLSDNKVLTDQDPDYARRLMALTPADQAIYVRGNWKRKPGRGDYFQRGWFHRWADTSIERSLGFQPQLQELKRTVRAWDLAATPGSPKDLVPGVERPEEFSLVRDTGYNEDPDWTRGVKVAQDKQGRSVILDMKSCRDTPGAVDQLIRQTAIDDGPHTVVLLWQDPGQAGVAQVESIRKLLRGIARVVAIPARRAKETNAKRPSSEAYKGRIYYAPTLDAMPFFAELEAFPKGAHDDIVDALALAYVYFEEHPISRYAYDAIGPTPDRETPRQRARRRGRDRPMTQRFREEL